VLPTTTSHASTTVAASDPTGRHSKLNPSPISAIDGAQVVSWVHDAASHVGEEQRSSA